MPQSSFTEEPCSGNGLRRACRGMTIIELVIALAIVAILAGISLPALTTTLRRSKVNSTRAEMTAIGKSMRAYAEDRGFDSSDFASGRWPDEHAGAGSYPTILGDELESDTDGTGWNPVLRQGWNGPYITGESVETQPTGVGTPATVRSYQIDAWDRYYVYRNRDATGGAVGSEDAVRVVELISGGPDRTMNTEDDLSLTVYRGPVH